MRNEVWVDGKRLSARKSMAMGTATIKTGIVMRERPLFAKASDNHPMRRRERVENTAKRDTAVLACEGCCDEASIDARIEPMFPTNVSALPAMSTYPIAYNTTVTSLKNGGRCKGADPSEFSASSGP